MQYRNHRHGALKTRHCEKHLEHALPRICRDEATCSSKYMVRDFARAGCFVARTYCRLISRMVLAMTRLDKHAIFAALMRLQGRAHHQHHEDRLEHAIAQSP